MSEEILPPDSQGEAAEQPPVIETTVVEGHANPASMIPQQAQQAVEAPSEDDAPATEDSAVIAKSRDPLSDSTTVKQTDETYEPMTPAQIDAYDTEAPWLAIAPTTEAAYDRAMETMPNVEVNEEWATHVGAGFAHTVQRQVFNTSLARGNWAQQVTYNGTALQARKPKIREDGEGQLLRGAAAVQRVLALTGLGGQIQIPLYHSGLWVTLRTPADSDLLDLYRRMEEEKIILGRQTFGMVFSNATVFWTGYLFRFIMDHIVDVSLKDNRDQLESLIKVQDMQHLAWGLACVTYPQGFIYARSVLGRDVAEDRVVRGKLNVTKLQFVDTSRLTDEQISHLSRRGHASTDLASVKRYQEQMTTPQTRRVEISPNVFITLKVPSVVENITNGQQWVNDIVIMTNKALSAEVGSDERNRYIRDQGKATYMRQYSHFVEKIELGGDTVEDLETIQQVLDRLSGRQEIMAKYFEAVNKFIDDSAVAIIATPTVEESEDKYTLPRFPYLIPLDASATFFTLLKQKVEAIQSRAEQ